MANKKKNGMMLAAAALAAGSMFGNSAQGGAITPGDLTVYRVGTGVGALASSGTAVFIDEYTTGGVLVQSIPVGTIASGSNHALVASGTATSEGLLTTSLDGNTVVFAGYDAAVGTASITSSSATSVARVVGVLNVSTGAIDTTTALSDYSTASNPRGVASPDGNTFYLSGGAGGIRTATFGGTSSTVINASVITNVRGLTLTGGNLNFSDSSGTTYRVGQVGSGIPVSGTSSTELPGISGTNGSPYQMFFADTDGTPGIDTLYVAEDTAGGGEILKYSLDSGTWVAKGLVTAPTVRGLTGSVSGSNVTLYAANGASIYSYTDTTGYDASISGAATVIASAGSNTAFRGISIVPAPEPTSLAILAVGAGALLARRRQHR